MDDADVLLILQCQRLVVGDGHIHSLVRLDLLTVRIQCNVIKFCNRKTGNILAALLFLYSLKRILVVALVGLALLGLVAVLPDLLHIQGSISRQIGILDPDDIALTFIGQGVNSLFLLFLGQSFVLGLVVRSIALFRNLEFLLRHINTALLVCFVSGESAGWQDESIRYDKKNCHCQQYCQSSLVMQRRKCFLLQTATPSAIIVFHSRPRSFFTLSLSLTG